MFDREREPTIKFMISCTVTSANQHEETSQDSNLHMSESNQSDPLQNTTLLFEYDNHMVPTKSNLLLQPSTFTSFRKQCVIQILDR